MAPMHHEDLPKEFTDELDGYSIQDLQLKIFRMQKHYNRQTGHVVALSRKIADQNAVLYGLEKDYNDLVAAADFQDDMLQVIGGFMDDWLNRDCVPGSRDRTVQIAVEELANELGDLHAAALAGAMEETEFDSWDFREEMDDESIHALYDEDETEAMSEVTGG